MIKLCKGLVSQSYAISPKSKIKIKIQANSNNKNNNVEVVP
jgi:hypothetical protein